MLITPIIALVERCDVCKKAVVLNDAFEHLDRIVMDLPADRMPVTPGSGDDEQQWLTTSPCGADEFVVQFAILMGV